jgi:hypothetical protein
MHFVLHQAFLANYPDFMFMINVYSLPDWRNLWTPNWF